MVALCPVDGGATSVPNDHHRYDPVIERRDHRVAVLAFPGLAPFELGVVAEAFALARPELEVDRWYSLAVCAERPGPIRAVGGFDLLPRHGLGTFARADTLIVPGAED